MFCQNDKLVKLLNRFYSCFLQLTLIAMMSLDTLDPAPPESVLIGRGPLPRPVTSHRPCRASLIDSLLSPTEGYESLHNKCDIHPEADVRQRHGRERAIRAHYLEARVAESLRECEAFRADARSENKAATAEAVQERYHQLMDAFCVNLDRISTYLASYFACRLTGHPGEALMQDTFVANAPVPNEHFMKEVFWPELADHRGPLAPNGELKAIYGRPGEPMPRNLTTPRGCPDDIVRAFITLKLMIPANDYIVEPIQDMINKCLGRERNQGRRGLDSRTLDLITSGVETLWITGLMLVAVVVVYNLDSMRNRLIATGVSTIFVLFPLAILSPQAVKILTVAVAYVHLPDPLYPSLAGIVYSIYADCRHLGRYWATIAVVIFTSSGAKND